MDGPEPTPGEVAQVAAEVAAVERALSRPTIYPSAQRGPEPIADMNRTHAARAARLVRAGERPGGESMAKALDRQSRTPRQLTK
jgi:hypothetical protein